MQNRAPASTNYIFKLNREKQIQGYKMAYNSLEDIKNIPISDLEREADVRGGWVKLSSDSNDKVLNHIKEAKWVLRFPKGSPVINEAWKILVNLVEKGELWDVKASAKSDKFPAQVICVYVGYQDKLENDLFNIVSVYNLLLKNNLIQLHLDQEVNQGEINFITDESTRLHDSRPVLTGADVSDLSKLLELKDTVSDKMFSSRWGDFSGALMARLDGRPGNEHIKRTYYSEEEAGERLKLLMDIDQYQVGHLEAVNPAINELILKTRSTLTSNYKFTTVELLQHTVNLLNHAKPKQPFLGFFKKNPEIKTFEEVADYFNRLIDRENTRLENKKVVSPRF